LNRRWSTFMGRAGTILMAAGIALVVLSLIPARTEENTDFEGTSLLQPKTYSVESSFFLSFMFDPQRGLYVNVQANRSVTVYLLNIGREYVYEWIADHFSEYQSSSSTAHTTVLESFLSNNPNSVAWQGNTPDGRLEFQYAPTKLMNVTLIFSNPSTEIAEVRYHGKLLNFIVPSERALTPAKFALPVGFVLAIPWLNSARKRMVTKPLSEVVQASSTVSQKSEKTKAQ